MWFLKEKTLDGNLKRLTDIMTVVLLSCPQTMINRRERDSNNFTIVYPEITYA